MNVLQSLIAGRWLGADAALPLHGAINGSLIHHTHTEAIDFGEAVAFARGTGKKLESMGFKNLYDLGPGFDGWKKAGKPIEK